MIEDNDKYFELLNDIKRTLITTRNKVVANANKNLILMYYNIGLKLVENIINGVHLLQILWQKI